MQKQKRGKPILQFADVDSIIARKSVEWRAPRKLTANEWAEENFYLSSESSAQPGRWVSLPYQKEILNCLSDPRVTYISVMKSARVGYTKLINAGIGYFIEHDPTSIFVVQPTLSDAKGYSKEEIEPMFRDSPTLSKMFFEDIVDSDSRAHESRQTILHKKFPGGIISMVGANSGAGFRRISRRIIMMDEIDAYPPSAGNEGDPIRLAINRSEYFYNRKIVMGSTPLLKGASRIEEKFYEGDQRRFHVPCPHCGHFDFLVFSERPDNRGHCMKWPEHRPEEAYFVCSKNKCHIQHSQKREMVTRGKWIAEATFKGHASFHIWAAYSFSPNATWGNLASEFVDAKRRGPDTLKVFVNTALGETWKERGEAPDWERIYSRRAKYQIGIVPNAVRFLTCGVDVQKDRWVYEVVGWAPDKKSWSIDYGVIMGNTAHEADWHKVTELLERTYLGDDGREFGIRMLAIDSGYNTQHVYNWVRNSPQHRVMACKGVSSRGIAGARNLIGTPKAIDVKHNGKRHARGLKLWTIGVDRAKEELYGFLRLPLPTEGEEYPPGFCFFPEYDAEYFKQLTAEQLVSSRHKKTGVMVYEWALIPGRENHALDARNYARAAASQCGLDRKAINAKQVYKDAVEHHHSKQERVAQPQEQQPQQQQRQKPRQQQGKGFLGGSGLLRNGRKSWL